MTTYNKERLSQQILWGSSILCHLLMLAMLILMHKAIDIKSISFMFSAFIVGLMGNSIIILRKSIDEGVVADRVPFEEKMKSRIHLMLFNASVATVYMIFLIYMLIEGIDVSPVSEMYIAYYSAIIGKEGYSYYRQPSVYDSDGYTIEPYSRNSEEGGGEFMNMESEYGRF